MKLDAWLKNSAPSDSLQRWFFRHNPPEWDEFQNKYRAEWSDYLDSWKSILKVTKPSFVARLQSSDDTQNKNVSELKIWNVMLACRIVRILHRKVQQKRFLRRGDVSGI